MFGGGKFRPCGGEKRCSGGKIGKIDIVLDSFELSFAPPIFADDSKSNMGCLPSKERRSHPLSAPKADNIKDAGETKTFNVDDAALAAALGIIAPVEAHSRATSPPTTTRTNVSGPPSTSPEIENSSIALPERDSAVPSQKTATADLAPAVVDHEGVRAAPMYAWGAQRAAGFVPVVPAPKSASVTKTYPISALRDASRVEITKAVSFASESTFVVIERLPEWSANDGTEAIGTFGTVALSVVAAQVTEPPHIADPNVLFRHPDRLKAMQERHALQKETQVAKENGNIPELPYEHCATTTANTTKNEFDTNWLGLLLAVQHQRFDDVQAFVDRARAAGYEDPEWPSLFPVRSESKSEEDVDDSSSMESVNFDTVGPTEPIFGTFGRNPLLVPSPSPILGVLTEEEDDDDEDEKEEDFKNNSGSAYDDDVAEGVFKATDELAVASAAESKATATLIAAFKANEATLEARIAELVAANTALMQENGLLIHEAKVATDHIAELKLHERVAVAVHSSKLEAMERKAAAFEAAVDLAEYTARQSKSLARRMQKENSELKQQLKASEAMVSELEAAIMSEKNATSSLTRELSHKDLQLGEARRRSSSLLVDLDLARTETSIAEQRGRVHCFHSRSRSLSLATPAAASSSASVNTPCGTLPLNIVKVGGLRTSKI